MAPFQVVNCLHLHINLVLIQIIRFFKRVVCEQNDHRKKDQMAEEIQTCHLDALKRVFKSHKL